MRVEILDGPLPADRRLGCSGGMDGAVVEFQGIVRATEHGEPIAGIDYECHVEMARVQLTRIAEELAAAHALSELTVLHRVGLVPVGETSLYLRAVAPHRKEAFAAAQELIDRLKRDVPIWKHPQRTT